MEISYDVIALSSPTVTFPGLNKNTELELLNIDCTQVTGSIPNLAWTGKIIDFGHLTNLVILEFQNNKFKDKAPGFKNV